MTNLNNVKAGELRVLLWTGQQLIAGIRHLKMSSRRLQEHEASVERFDNSIRLIDGHWLTAP